VSGCLPQQHMHGRPPQIKLAMCVATATCVSLRSATHSHSHSHTHAEDFDQIRAAMEKVPAYASVFTKVGWVVRERGGFEGS
jgi:hypothetical protein